MTIGNGQERMSAETQAAGLDRDDATAKFSLAVVLAPEQVPGRMVRRSRLQNGRRDNRGVLMGKRS